MHGARTTQAKEHEEFVTQNKTLQMVSSKKYMVCTLCLENPDKELIKCLRKVQPNQMTNYNKHAKEHEERISEIKKEKLAKLKEKQKKDGQNSKVSISAVFVYILL